MWLIFPSAFSLFVHYFLFLLELVFLAVDRDSPMAAVIRSFDYSRVRGRGKGVLGLKEFRGVKNSSETVDVQGAVS